MSQPAPTWQTADGSVKLYLGDCLDVLPTLEAGSVDAVVTSPPYNTLPKSHKPSGLHGQRKSGANRWISKAVEGYEDSMPEDEYQRWLVAVLDECRRISSGLVWVNHKIRYRDGEAVHPARMFPWPIYSEVIWDRAGSMALNCKRFAPSTEHLLGFGRPVVWNDHLNKLMSVWRLGFDRDDNDHPCAYPVELAERPIEASTRPHSVVLDPFMGSGSTALACLRTGRRAIGIEKHKPHFEGCINRIIEELERMSLFDPAPVIVQRELI